MEERKEMGDVELRHGVANFKQDLAGSDEPLQSLHGLCSMTEVINSKLFNLHLSSFDSWMHPQLLSEL